MSKVHEGLSPSTYENVLNDQGIVSSESLQERTCTDDALAVSFDVVADKYWKAALELVKTASKAISRYKLYQNVANPLKFHAVKKTLDDYYGGSRSALLVSRDKAVDDFFSEVDMFNEACLRRAFPQLNGLWLLGELSGENGNMLRKFSVHIKKHISRNDPPIPLEDLPAHDFRKPRK